MCKSCGCNRITSTKGDKGDTGATGATGPQGPAGPAGADGSPPPTYTFQQTFASSNDIHAGGSGYDFVISNSMPAGVNAFYTMTFTVTGSDVFNINTYPIVNGLADTSYQMKHSVYASGGTGYATVTLSGWVAYAAGNTFKMHIVANTAAVTPRLKSVMGFMYVL